VARRSILFCPYCGTKRATRRKACAACGGDLAALTLLAPAPTASEVERPTAEPASAPRPTTERPLPVVPGITRREDLVAAEASVSPPPALQVEPAPALAPAPARATRRPDRLSRVLGILLLGLIVADVVAVLLAHNAGYLTFSPPQPTPPTIFVTPAPGN
jgi:hypothetical protein